MRFPGEIYVKPALIDTDVLSLFFRGHPAVTARFENYLADFEKVNISIITYYEILSGLKHRDAHRKMEIFLEFVSENTILPLTEKSVTVSANLYATLRRQGNPLDDIDLLIAGIAVTNEQVLATRNTKHFQRIDILEIEDWTKKTNHPTGSDGSQRDPSPRHRF